MSKPPILPQSDWVYGPVDSRRLGRSLGVNLLPKRRKLCNMDCVYCQYDTEEGQDQPNRLPEIDEVLRAVETALVADSSATAITLAGNGEPTLHPKFAEILPALVEIRDDLVPQALICLLSNGTRLLDPDVRSVLELIDRPIFKLDAGTDEGLHRVNRPRGADLAQIVQGLESVPNYFVQSMFLITSDYDNTTPENLAPWLSLITRLRPNEVQVCTVDRGTQEQGIMPIPAARLQAVAAMVREVGIPATAYACRDEAGFD